MKLALITRRFPPAIGGAEKVLGYLAPALAELGNDVTVLTSRLDPSLPAFEAIATSRGSCDLVRLPTSRLRFVGTWLYMRALARWLERHPVDLAYVSMLKHDAHVAVGAGRRRGFPVALRPEGAGTTGDIAWQSWGRFGSRIADRCRQADAFVAISEAVKAELIAAKYDPEKIIELPNGVPVPDAPWSPPANAAPRAVFLGRLAPEKGLDTLLDAWQLVRREYPEARLVLAGEGPLRSALDDRVRALGPVPGVELPGATADPNGLLRSAELFVLPSLEEGMSIALLEAMALGIPLVATAIPGNRKLVNDAEHGLLVSPGDPAALAQAITAQWTQPDRAQVMGRAARRRVEDHYSISMMALKHHELFTRLVKPPR